MYFCTCEDCLEAPNQDLKFAGGLQQYLLDMLDLLIFLAKDDGGVPALTDGVRYRCSHIAAASGPSAQDWNCADLFICCFAVL